MLNYLFVGLGAAFGGALRYWLSGVMQKLIPSHLPVGTLTVNVLGSFLLGFLIFGLEGKDMLSGEWKLVLATGFCGAFTTFSTFSLEVSQLLKESKAIWAILTIGLNVCLTLLAVVMAYLLAKWISV